MRARPAGSRDGLREFAFDAALLTRNDELLAFEGLGGVLAPLEVSPSVFSFFTVTGALELDEPHRHACFFGIAAVTPEHEHGPDDG